MLTNAERLAVPAVAAELITWLVAHGHHPDTAALTLVETRNGVDVVLTIGNVDTVVEAHLLHEVAAVYRNFRLVRPHTEAPLARTVSDEWIREYERSRGRMPAFLGAFR